MNLEALNIMMKNAETLNGGNHQQQHDKTLLIGAGQSGGIAPEKPPLLDGLRLTADFVDKSQSKAVDNITVKRDSERDVIHITIELL